MNFNEIENCENNKPGKSDPINREQSLLKLLSKKLHLNVGLMIVAEPEVLKRDLAICKSRTVVALCVRKSTVLFLHAISNCKLFLNHSTNIV